MGCKEKKEVATEYHMGQGTELFCPIQCNTSDIHERMTGIGNTYVKVMSKRPQLKQWFHYLRMDTK